MPNAIALIKNKNKIQRLNVIANVRKDKLISLDEWL